MWQGRAWVVGSAAMETEAVPGAGWQAAKTGAACRSWEWEPAREEARP